MALTRCSICGIANAEYKCRICGRLVCSRDYIKSQGICLICKDTMCEICGKYLSIGYCMICGRIGCEDCLVQVSTVAYVCKKCIQEGRYKFEIRGR
ncbi:MAG: hypothetical protein DRO40_04835 [Thermoprotei archaeon]|nr:MAG: hypothetical protein DRO40_04835 [Thermoprotei archaeon]